jgi:FAD:protein FMN transferase
VSGPAVAHWPALGTTATVVVADPGGLDAARDAVSEEVEAIDRAASRFRADSELTCVNERAGRWTAIGPLLMRAIVTALRAAELTEGAVDPTVGAALVAAGYDRDFAAGLREPETVALRRVPGWRTVALDRAGGRVRLPRGARLDLGATAKALAADRAARAAADACGAGVLVSLGGDIATAGVAPDGGWLVRVTDDHRDAAWAAGQTVVLRAGALATSSTAVRRWGAGVHHLIDPRTARPAASPWRTVSVAAASCVDANIASTAAIVRGADAPAWLTERGLPARLVDHEGVVEMLSGWPA